MLWKKNHPALVRPQVRMQTIKQNSQRRFPGNFDIKAFLIKFNSFRCRCYYCGQILTLYSVTPDHLNNLQKGGTNNINNIVPACLHCNDIKATLTLEEYILKFSFPKLFFECPITHPLIWGIRHATSNEIWAL